LSFLTSPPPFCPVWSLVTFLYPFLTRLFCSGYISAHGAVRRASPLHSHCAILDSSLTPLFRSCVCENTAPKDTSFFLSDVLKTHDSIFFSSFRLISPFFNNTPVCFERYLPPLQNGPELASPPSNFFSPQPAPVPLTIFVGSSPPASSNGRTLL